MTSGDTRMGFVSIVAFICVLIYILLGLLQWGFSGIALVEFAGINNS